MEKGLSTDYPGQEYFHEHNANIRRSEENWHRKQATIMEKGMSAHYDAWYAATQATEKRLEAERDALVAAGERGATVADKGEVHHNKGE